MSFRRVRPERLRSFGVAEDSRTALLWSVRVASVEPALACEMPETLLERRILSRLAATMRVQVHPGRVILQPPEKSASV